jgi:hypothetical protein
MNRADTLDAVPIAQRLLKRLAACIPVSGRIGAHARAALGDVAVNIAALLVAVPTVLVATTV